MRYQLHSWLRLGVLLVLLSSTTPGVRAAPTRAAGTPFVVATTGNDANPGTITQPLRTVQRCAELAHPGDTCLIRAGTYRETIRPAYSGTAAAPIVFRAYQQEHVTISGADTITGWTSRDLGGGRLAYAAPMPWSMNVRVSFTAPLQVSNDQLFINGSMLPEAQWPNVPVAAATRRTNAMHARASGATVHSDFTASYADPALQAFAADVWTGAKINFSPGSHIYWTTCDVTDSTASTVAFTCNPDPGANNTRTNLNDEWTTPGAQDYYFLWGTLAALDAPGEWFRADDGTLYLMTPDGQHPGSKVEARRRPWAFNLSGRSHITLEGLRLFAAGIYADQSSSFLDLAHLDVQYPWHVQELPPPSWSNGTPAIRLQGTHNTLRDSMLRGSAAAMVSLGGEHYLPATRHFRLINNVIANAAYMGGHSTILAGNISADDGHAVHQNTLFDSGNVHIPAAPGLDITYNDAYASHLQSSDLGTIAICCTTGYNNQIAYNLVHENRAERNLPFRFFGGAGIFLDDDARNYRIHHNIVWDTSTAGITVFGTDGPSNREIYNNTVDGIIYTMLHIQSYTMEGTILKNNVAHGFAMETNRGLVATNNSTGDPGWYAWDAHDYRLQPASPAIDAGMVLPPYTDGFVGRAPDLGALEAGKPPFVAGALVRPSDMVPLTLTCLPDLALETARCSISDFPVGRKLPESFQVRVGEFGRPSAGCITSMDYATHRGRGSCDRVDVEGQRGIQPVWIRTADTEWIDSGETIDLGALAVHAVIPAAGPAAGGSRVTVVGRHFAHDLPGATIPITLTNRSGKPQTSYQTNIVLDTATLVRSGALRADCGNLRFNDGYGTLRYWIEGGCNTTATQVWIRVPIIPPGTSAITATLGSLSQEDASSGRATFLMFDDFSDGTLNSFWMVGQESGVQVRESQGSLEISGATTETNQYSLFGATLNPGGLWLPSKDYAYDSRFSVTNTAPDTPFKASIGGRDTVLSLYTANRDRRVGYYANGFVDSGDSGLDSNSVAPTRLSIGFTADGTVRYFEHGTLRASRAGLPAGSTGGSFGYSPNSVSPSFTARFDDIRVRRFTYPEPVATVGTATRHAPQVLFGASPCRDVVVRTSTELECTTPAHPAGIVTVHVVVSTGAGVSAASLPNAYRYQAVSHQRFLSLIVSGTANAEGVMNHGWRGLRHQQR